MSNLNKFVQSIIENGGATYNLVTGEFNPDSGYMVSLRGHERKLAVGYLISFAIRQKIKGYASDMLNELVKEFVSDFAACLTNSDNFLGAWVHEDNLYLDVSRKVDTSIEAHTLALKNKQLAYYDNVKKESVYLKPVISEYIPEANNLEDIEKAIFSGYKQLKYDGKVFNLPSLQKSGTMQQNRDYVYLKAKEILFHKLQ